MRSLEYKCQKIMKLVITANISKDYCNSSGRSQEYVHTFFLL